MFVLKLSSSAYRMPLVLGCLSSLLFWEGCGGGTSVGNPAIEPVALQSSSYTNTALMDHLERFFLIATAFAAPVTEMKFCVTKLKLSNESDKAVNFNGASEIEAKLGLIDVSESTQVASWGTVNIPVAFTLKELKIEIHQDESLCGGAAYSLTYNGTPITKDLEFKFEFNPTVYVQANDTLTLGLSNIARAIEQAKQAGALTNELISNYLTETTKGSGEK